MTPEQQEALLRAQRAAALQRASGGKPTEAPQTADEGGVWQTVKDNLLGDDDPNSQNLGERIGSAINKTGEAFTFGLVGDEADAAVAAAIPGGMDYDERLAHNRQQEEILEQENPALALGSEVTGGVLGAVLPLGKILKGGQALGRLGQVGQVSGGSIGRRLAASTAAGAGLGATYGFMEGEDGLDNRIDEATSGAAIGGAVGAASVPLASGVQRVADAVRSRRAIQRGTSNAPTSAELRAQGKTLYNQVDDAGVQIDPQAFSRLRGRSLQNLRENTGFDELPGPGSLTPRSARVMQIMDEASQEMAPEEGAALPFRSLDQMRRQAGTAVRSRDDSDVQAGMQIIGDMDDFVENLSADDVLAGDVEALQEALPKARDTWARMSRSQAIDDAIEQEGNYLSGGSSAIKNQFARILRSDEAKRFTPAERAAMQRVVRGTIPEQFLNLAGSGLGMIAQVGGGMALGGPFVGGALGAGAAAVSRKGAEALTRRNAEIARALVANGTLKQLPAPAESIRQITEALGRRTGVASSQ